MAFVKSSSVECATSYNLLFAAFDKLFRLPFSLNNKDNIIKETINQWDTNVEGECAFCLVSEIITTKVGPGKGNENTPDVDVEMEASPAKRTKIDPSVRQSFPRFLTAPCEECLKCDSSKVQGILRDIVLFWFKDLGADQKVKSNFRRLTSKDETLLPTYEWALYHRNNSRSDSKFTVVIMPICTVEDPQLLMHRSYGLTYTQQDKQLSTYLHSHFSNGVSDKAFVLTDTGLNQQYFSRINKLLSDTSNRFKRALSLVNPQKYYTLYSELKEKYASYLIQIWSGNNDPLFFVYKGIAVACYILLLWRKERSMQRTQEKQSFVDIRCGNGLLVYILSHEGHVGKGMDISRDDMWDSYDGNITLEAGPIYPHKLKVEADWIIGYNADELTPWIPIIASRSDYTTRFFMLPCCLYEFEKLKEKPERHDVEDYHDYMKFLTSVADECGFNVEEDVLQIRVQSRKCIIGRSRTSKVELVPWYSQNIDEVAKVILTKHNCSVDLDEVEKNGEYAFKVVKHDLKSSSEMNHRVKEEMYDAVLVALLSGQNVGYKVEGEEDKETSTGKKWSEWNSGSIHNVSDLEKLFHPDLLSNFTGGLGRFLGFRKNLFKVTEEGNVSLRDYRDPEQVPRSAPHRKDRRPARFGCWFHKCHPQGCLLTDELCRDSHAEEDMNA